MKQNTVLRAEDVCKSFANNGGQNHVLDMINLAIYEGDFTVIMGSSGAGKSTLLHILACIDGYDSGEYTIDGEEVGKISERQMAQERNEKIGMVMQDFALVEGTM